ncbi:hypothetical protein ACFXGY_26785, partial [Streptomyces sp. NPDC059346]|uniref:hypothetical protein n=1 Tax=Streptomyces sp. NPDC059346 TaxID=3346807 RepID=UPI0036A02C75
GGGADLVGFAARFPAALLPSGCPGCAAGEEEGPASRPGGACWDTFPSPGADAVAAPWSGEAPHPWTTVATIEKVTLSVMVRRVARLGPRRRRRRR